MLLGVAIRQMDEQVDPGARHHRTAELCTNDYKFSDPPGPALDVMIQGCPFQTLLVWLFLMRTPEAGTLSFRTGNVPSTTSP